MDIDDRRRAEQHSRIRATKLALAMRALGHRTETAMNGAEALLRVRERPFDVILLDIVMPEMDGYAVLKALKEDEAHRDIPVIVVSSLDDEIGSVVRATSSAPRTSCRRISNRQS